MSPALAVAKRLGSNLVRGGRRLLLRGSIPRRERFWLELNLAGPLDELRGPGWTLGERGAGLAFVEVLQSLDVASRDPQVGGVLLRIDGAPQGFAKALALRRAIDAVRGAGKPVAAWAPTLGAAELMVAAGATRAWLPESGAVLLLGVRAEALFVRGLLGKLGVRPDVVRVGSHKTAAETFTRDAMSPEQREQVEAVVDDLYAQLVDEIARGRGLAPEAVRALIDRGPFAAPAAVEAGLVDGCLYPDEIDAALIALAPDTAETQEHEPDGSEAEAEEARARRVEAPLYAALRVADTRWRPLRGDLPRLAYVVASGAISRGGGGLRGVGSDGLRRLLERLREDDDVRGIVLRVDSPGGDGVASDLLWRSVRRIAAEKPVVVSMGEVAASGGYYVASAADAVFAEAATLTGSIGVVGGKADLSEAYARLGIGTDAVERGARAGMLSEARPFDAGERGALRAQMESLYEGFVRKVAEGRRLDPAAVERAAQGRVWSGRRAAGLGLVDALGGPLEALRDLRRRAGLAEGERALFEMHPRMAPLAGLRMLLGLALGVRGLGGDE